MIEIDQRVWICWGRPWRKTDARDDVSVQVKLWVILVVGNCEGTLDGSRNGRQVNCWECAQGFYLWNVNKILNTVIDCNCNSSYIFCLVDGNFLLFAKSLSFGLFSQAIGVRNFMITEVSFSWLNVVEHTPNVWIRLKVGGESLPQLWWLCGFQICFGIEGSSWGIFVRKLCQVC